MKKAWVTISLLIIALAAFYPLFTVDATGASITLSPSTCLANTGSGSLGYNIACTVSGTGFAPNSLVTITGPIYSPPTGLPQPPNTVTTDVSGSFSLSTELFGSHTGGTSPGLYTISATDGLGNSASAQIKLETNVYIINFAAVAGVGSSISDGTSWSVTLDGVQKTGTFSSGSCTISFTLPSGSYDYSVTIPTGASTSSATSGTINAAGQTGDYGDVSTLILFDGGSLTPTPESNLGSAGILLVSIAVIVAWTFFYKRKERKE